MDILHKIIECLSLYRFNNVWIQLIIKNVKAKKMIEEDKAKQKLLDGVPHEKDAALKRFRFIPEQPGVHTAVLNHLAEYGLKEVSFAKV